MYLYLVVEQIYRFKASVIFLHLPLRRAAVRLAVAAVSLIGNSIIGKKKGRKPMLPPCCPLVNRERLIMLNVILYFFSCQREPFVRVVGIICSAQRRNK